MCLLATHMFSLVKCPSTSFVIFSVELGHPRDHRWPRPNLEESAQLCGPWTTAIPTSAVECAATRSGNTPNIAAELDKAAGRRWAMPGSWRCRATRAYPSGRSCQTSRSWQTYSESPGSGARRPVLCARRSCSSWLNPDSSLYHTDLIKVSMALCSNCHSSWGTQRLMTLLSQVHGCLPSESQWGNPSCQQVLTFWGPNTQLYMKELIFTAFRLHKGPSVVMVPIRLCKLRYGCG